MLEQAIIFWATLVTELTQALPAGSALAYLDPGSGSLIIQLVIAGLLGLAVAAKVFWVNILAFLRIKERTANDNDDDDTDE